MLRVDDELCICCGICGDMLPQYFELSGSSVRVKPAAAAPGLAAQLAAAAEDCPVSAIIPDAGEPAAPG